MIRHPCWGTVLGLTSRESEHRRRAPKGMQWEISWVAGMQSRVSLQGKRASTNINNSNSGTEQRSADVESSSCGTCLRLHYSVA